MFAAYGTPKTDTFRPKADRYLQLAQSNLLTIKSCLVLA